MNAMNLNKMMEKLGIWELNDMQQEARQVILGKRNDVLILSPTGTGKTLAYLLPLVQLIDAGSDKVQALVVVPGRELALQSDTVLKSLGSGLRSQSCYGGRTAMEEHRVLRQNRPQVIFGTPGRLNDHLDKGNIEAHHIKYIVIDEFNKCLEMGFLDEMTRLLERLTAVERRILLSATEKGIDGIGHSPLHIDHSWIRVDYLDHEDMMNNVNRSTVDGSKRVEVYRVDCPQRDKLDTLGSLLLSLGQQQSIVFLNYRESVERVDAYLRDRGFVTSAFHGGLEQRQREDALYRFSNGSATVLVSTDLASRGLDIPQIDNIIHYHLPQNEEALVHRVGRTARWDATGRTFFLVGPEESLDYSSFFDESSGAADQAIEQYDLAGIMADGQGSMPNGNKTANIPQPRMATLYIGKGKKDKLSKGDIVGFLCKTGGLTAEEIGRIDVKDRYAYVAIARPRLQMVLRNVQGGKIKGLRTVVEQVR